MQLDHYSSKFNRQSFPIVLISDGICNASNVGSLFRTADAFGVEKLYLCGDHVPLGRKMWKTARATHQFVDYDVCQDVIELIHRLKDASYTIISLEITSTSHPLSTYDFKRHSKIALVVGSENFGVSQQVLDLSDEILHIAMYGQNSSMNVVQATSIALYDMTRALHAK